MNTENRKTKERQKFILNLAHRTWKMLLFKASFLFIISGKTTKTINSK